MLSWSAAPPARALRRSTGTGETGATRRAPQQAAAAAAGARHRGPSRGSAAEARGEGARLPGREEKGRGLAAKLRHCQSQAGSAEQLQPAPRAKKFEKSSICIEGTRKTMVDGEGE